MADISRFTEGVALGTQIADPGNAGAIPLTAISVECLLTTGGAETRTLAVPTLRGQTVDLTLSVDGGNCVLTVASAINAAGNTILTFADAGDNIRLEAIRGAAGVLRWTIARNDGVALS